MHFAFRDVHYKLLEHVADTRFRFLLEIINQSGIVIKITTDIIRKNKITQKSSIKHMAIKLSFIVVFGFDFICNQNQTLFGSSLLWSIFVLASILLSPFHVSI